MAARRILGRCPAYSYSRKKNEEKEPECIEGKLGFYCMAIDTAITAGTWDAAQASAAVALSAQNAISDGENVAFALCRPPGHHAAKDLYGGYCFLNNAAIAAQGFLEKGASKVAILDVDFHHGNGTQDIFYDRSDVLFLSLHGDPKQAFPYFFFCLESGFRAGFKKNSKLQTRFLEIIFLILWNGETDSSFVL